MSKKKPASVRSADSGTKVTTMMAKPVMQGTSSRFAE